MPDLAGPGRDNLAALRANEVLRLYDGRLLFAVLV